METRDVDMSLIFWCLQCYIWVLALQLVRWALKPLSLETWTMQRGSRPRQDTDAGADARADARADEYPDGLIRLRVVGTDPLPISGLDRGETKSFEHPRSTVFPTKLSPARCILLSFDWTDSPVRVLTWSRNRLDRTLP